MIPSLALAQSIVNAAAADAAYLASVTAMKVTLVKSNFVPSRTLVLASLELAAFTGSTPKTAGTGTQDVFHDPQSNMRTIQLKEPAGGWQWKCTAAPAEPEIIYGFVVTDNAGTGLIGSELLPEPITISAVDDGMSIPYIRLRFLSTSPV